MKFMFYRQNIDSNVTFNLVAPFHSLDLFAVNEETLPINLAEASKSTEGFLSFPSNTNINNDFSLIVVKRESYRNKSIHFTLIASTSDKEVRLETGITHYETLSAEGSSPAEYIFEFDSSE